MEYPVTLSSQIVTTASTNHTLCPDILEVDVPDSARILALIACSLSTLGSLTIIITYIIWHDIRTMSRYLLFCLASVDLVGALSFAYGTVMNFDSTTVDCIVQSTFSTFSQISSFLWTLSIAVYLYITIVWTNVDLANKLGVVYHVVSLGIPAVAVGVVLAFNGLGWDNSNVTVGWCWVNLESKYRFVWMMLAGKFWEFLACITLPILCVLMKVHIHTEHISGHRFESSYSSPQVVAMVSMDRRLTILPLVFVALRCWGILRFVLYQSGSPLAVNWTLVTIQGVAACSQGSANCILYFLLAKNVRQRLCQGVTCSRRHQADIYRTKQCSSCNFGCCLYACSKCKCKCCQNEYVAINTEQFYSDMAESSPLLHSARHQ